MFIYFSEGHTIMNTYLGIQKERPKKLHEVSARQHTSQQPEVSAATQAWHRGRGDTGERETETRLRHTKDKGDLNTS